MWPESVAVHSDYASLIAYTSKYYNHANFTPVYIISSEHMYNITFKGQKRKPAPMLMYNVSKKGVDKGNQMLAHNRYIEHHVGGPIAHSVITST